MIWATAGKHWANLLKPGTTIAAAIIVLAGLLSLFKAQEVPSDATWRTGATANTVLTFSAGGAMVLTFLMAVGYRRLLTANRQGNDFYSACRTVWGLVDEASDIDHRNLAVHVWTITGFPGARYLTRTATFKPQRRRASPVRWRKGKGAIGKCWETRHQSLEDLEPLELDEQGFCALARADRLYLSWEEYQHTRHYKAAWVTPIFRGPEGNRRVGGVLSVDVVNHDNAAAALDAATQARRRQLEDVLAFCHTVLQ